MLKRNLNDNICLEHLNAKKKSVFNSRIKRTDTRIVWKHVIKVQFYHFCHGYFFGLCIAKCDQSQLIVTTNLFIWQQKKPTTTTPTMTTTCQYANNSNANWRLMEIVNLYIFALFSMLLVIFATKMTHFTFSSVFYFVSSYVKYTAQEWSQLRYVVFLFFTHFNVTYK